MDVHITARKIKLHPKIKEHAIAELNKLKHYYEGILRCNVILSQEGNSDQSKVVDISLHLYGHDIIASEKSDNFYKSIDNAVIKLEKQISKIKSKLQMKDKRKVRASKGKI